MTRDVFDQQMSRLLGLRFVPADMTTHWEGLRDVPEAVLEAAVTRAQKTRVDFPTPVELRQDADQVAHLVQGHQEEENRATDLLEPLAIPVPQAAAVIHIRQTWAYDCERCSDTGWASWWCGAFETSRKPWAEPRTCDRRGVHGSHEWVGQCGCWDTNPSLIRRREAQRKYAEKPGKAA